VRTSSGASFHRIETQSSENLQNNFFNQPARVIPAGFLAVILLGTMALMTPAARAGAGHADFLTALFTAASVTCVAGLAVVDTATYWTGFGQFVICALIQIGGLGIMTGATLLSILMSRKISLQNRMLAQAETHTMGLGDVTDVAKWVFFVTASVELTVAGILSLNFHFRYDEPLPKALWAGLFHAVSAFNNVGYSTYSDNLIPFASDPVVLLPCALALIAGGIGFPVFQELFSKNSARKRPSMHLRATLWGYAILLLVGTVLFGFYEWSNEKTFGPMTVFDKILNAFFASAAARTGGFNSVDIGQMTTETLFVHLILMFIGGGSAGTAGGIKVTTFCILLCVVWSEVRGDPQSTFGSRAISYQTQRQALSVVLVSAAAVTLGTLVLVSVSNVPFIPLAFEAISAFATVGLSTGITADLPVTAKVTLILLMYAGRVGAVTLIAALTLRTTTKLYRYPEESPIVG
jgi:trk system potassium uptake protein TrkH